MSEAPSELWRTTVRRRLLIVIVSLVAWSTAIEARLAYLQIYKRADYVARAERQRQRTIEVPAPRGEVRDRYGRLLAASRPAASIYAVPVEIFGTHDAKDGKDASGRSASGARAGRDASYTPEQLIAAICGVMDSCTAEDRVALPARIRSKPKQQFMWLFRQVHEDEGRRVQALLTAEKLKSIGVMWVSDRYYPNGSLLANVLGFVDVDFKGIAGIEQSYDKTVRGVPGVAYIGIDAKHQVFERSEQAPVSGASLELTIDQGLQWIAEQELAAGVRENRAEGGTVIIMDPWTGDILAMASLPTFDPNQPKTAPPEHRHNPAVEHTYEPGSTFKLVTASAALEEHLIRPTDYIHVAPNYILIGSRRINDAHTTPPDLTFEDALVRSSNVAAVRVGQRIGAERMARYVARFGFGRRALRDLPGETRGIVWSELNDSALASVSMGYQIAVTPIQMITAASAVANGGQLMEPRLVRAVTTATGRSERPPVVVRRVVSAETASTLLGITEGVVARGTAKAAQIPGYVIGGKTGTSNQNENGRYTNKFNASFVGFLPARNPTLVMLVVLDAPSAGSHFGGIVAAPIFKRIAEAAIPLLGIQRTIDPPAPVLVDRREQPPTMRVARTGGASILAPEDPTLVPDLRGLSAGDALRRLHGMDVKPKVHGAGVVVAQKPEPGTPLAEARSWQLWLDRAVATTAAMVVPAGTPPEARP